MAEKGKQVYLGGYELEEHAASAYDVAGLKVKGARARTNFSLDKYKELLSYLNQVSFDELVLAVRRQSQGFAKGSSAFKGVSKHVTGKWESRIIVNGSKHIYLGVFEDELMAARVHDKALVRLKGHAASSLINFPLRDYEEQLLENQQSEALQQYIPFPGNEIAAASFASISREGHSNMHVFTRNSARSSSASGNRAKCRHISPDAVVNSCFDDSARSKPSQQLRCH